MEKLTKYDFTPVGKNISGSHSIVRPSINYWQDAWRRLRRNHVAMASLIILIIVTLLSIMGPWFSSYSFFEQNYSQADLGPFEMGHFFGTDSLGRDLFVRVCVGGRISLFIGVVVAFSAVLTGAAYGGISGFYGGRVDNMMMRIVDVMLTIPGMLLSILLLLVLEAGVTTIIIAFSLTSWLGMARLVRGQILQLKEQEFVLAARTLGASSVRIIFRHLIPNTMGVIIVHMTLIVPAAIFGEAFLSYIGLGVRPPVSSWGVLAAEGAKVLRFYPYQLIIPSIFISITMLSFNLLGDGLRDALDPKLRK